MPGTTDKVCAIDCECTARSPHQTAEREYTVNGSSHHCRKKGLQTMKIVVVRSPRLLAPILRRMFKIKKSESRT